MFRGFGVSVIELQLSGRRMITIRQVVLSPQYSEACCFQSNRLIKRHLSTESVTLR